MRNGYILLHRQGLTQEEWKHPLRTLAWFDFLTMAAWEDYIAEDGVEFKRGEVVASIGFLATRWRKSKGEVHRIIELWIRERKIERCRERCRERNGERFFVVNYAKYQDSGERVEERVRERSRERSREQMKENNVNKIVEKKIEKPDVVGEFEMELRQALPFLSKVLGSEKVITDAAVKKWEARRLKYSARELAEAFANLSRDQEKWWITNHGWRPLTWWLEKDERIEELKHCHLRRTKGTNFLSAD